MKKYMLRVLIAFDQLTNTLLGGFPNETLSSRAWRRGEIEESLSWKTFQVFIDWLFILGGDNHCELSYIYCKTNLKTCGLYFPIYDLGNKTIKNDTSKTANTYKLSIDHTDLLDD